MNITDKFDYKNILSSISDKGQPRILETDKALKMVESFRRKNCVRCAWAIKENLLNNDKGCCSHKSPDPEMWHNYCYTKKSLKGKKDCGSGTK
jgi:hypothetical protein